MKIKYNGGNESIKYHINAWKDDFSVFEKVGAEEITVIDNDPGDLNVSYKFMINDNTAEVELNYISGCALWLLSITLTCYSQKIVNQLSLYNDEKVCDVVFKLLEQLSY